MNIHLDTIAAVATAQGYGGIGVIRISGDQALAIAQQIMPISPQPRHAHYGSFLDEQNEVLDEGLLLFFPNPHSFTGEDVVELQGHGGPVVLDMLLQRCLALGARQARPGEFSERAFLNGKLDLAQAEAIADLIEASSAQAAKGALRSLQGAFSKEVHQLTEQLTQLRMYVEAAIDFPEEEIDFLADQRILTQLQTLQSQLEQLMHNAQQGSLLKDGMTVVIAGRPNAGKSSLLNALARREVAIVTDIAGTTRDMLKEVIHIDGMPLHVVDTAGLREASDQVEKIGIERAIQAISDADRILLVEDSTAPETECVWTDYFDVPPDRSRVTRVRNKIDLSGEPFGLEQDPSGQTVIRLSAHSQEGLELLCGHLKACVGYQQTAEGGFSARRRHLDALHQAQHWLELGKQQLECMGAGELLAEDLRLAQQALGEITGLVRPDDLLGRIFSSFCIGK